MPNSDSSNMAATAKLRIVNQALSGFSERTMAWLFIAPTMLLLLAINIFPLIWTIYLSFTNFKANRSTPVQYVGLRHYQDILTDNDVWQFMQATAHFVFWTIL